MRGRRHIAIMGLKALSSQTLTIESDYLLLRPNPNPTDFPGPRSSFFLLNSQHSAFAASSYYLPFSIFNYGNKFNYFRVIPPRGESKFYRSWGLNILECGINTPHFHKVSLYDKEYKIGTRLWKEMCLWEPWSFSFVSFMGNLLLLSCCALKINFFYSSKVDFHWLQFYEFLHMHT